jgi:hypothetical protein
MNTKLSKKQIEELTAKGISETQINLLKDEDLLKLLENEKKSFELQIPKKTTSGITQLLDKFVTDSNKLEFTRDELTEFIAIKLQSNFFTLKYDEKIIYLNKIDELAVYLNLDSIEFIINIDNNQINSGSTKKDKQNICVKLWLKRANATLNEICNYKHVKFFNEDKKGLKHKIFDIKTKKENFLFEVK